MSREFLKRGWKRYSRLGRKRKKIRVWRRAAGRQNKMRERKRGYANIVSIGYGREKTTRGKVQGKNPVMVYNTKDLGRVKKDEIIIIGNVGKKKKMEIAKRANEMKLDVQNLNIKRFLKKAERQTGNLKNRQAVLKKTETKESKEKTQENKK